jgi:hypothetical protein
MSQNCEKHIKNFASLNFVDDSLILRELEVKKVRLFVSNSAVKNNSYKKNKKLKITCFFYNLLR